MKYFDLHCDTFLNLYEENKSFDDPSIMAPPSLQSFDKYTQVAAFWSAHSKSADECYDTFLRASEYIKERRHLLPDNFSYIPAVEGGKLRLSLHKGGNRPDYEGDKGIHKTVYSFLPHNSGFTTEEVIRPAYELNIPVVQGKGAFDAVALVVPDVKLISTTASMSRSSLQ